MSDAPRRGLTPLLGIFLTVFLDLLSFGLVIPDIQLRGEVLGARDWQIGAVIATFSLTQLVTAPFLGRLSDRIGRKKILLVTTVMAALSFVAYAHAEALWLIFLSRALAGVAGANVGVAFAYVADVTTPENRSKGLGLIGAAFGLGFMLGPPAGAWLVKLGNGQPLILGYTAAGLALVNFAYVYFVLPEPARTDGGGQRIGQVALLRKAFGTPSLALLLAMFFVYNLGFANLESTYFRLLHAEGWIYGLTEEQARIYGAYVLVFVGIVSAFAQGFLIGKLAPRFGEVRLLRFAYLVLAPALAIVPFCPLWVPTLVGVAIMATAGGLAQPSLSALISRNAPKDMQGGIFGVTQALGALARVVGPLASNSLFGIAPYWPYLLGGTLVLFPAVASWFVRVPEADGPDGEAGPIPHG